VTVFIVLAAVMLALACAAVLVPLLQRRPAAVVERDATNLSVLRDQRGELEADLANGVISSEQYETALAELDRRVLDETRKEAIAADASRPGALTAVVVAAALPITAVVLYLALGTPSALSPGLAKAGAGEPGHEVTAQQIDSMIERVKERLAREPDNVEGWVVLARTYYVMGRTQDAAAAFERATALAPDDANLLADYADVLGMAQNQSLEGKPAEMIARALKADPTQWKANALAGTLAFSRKQYAKAIEHWERVKQTVPPDSPIAQSIDGSLAEARRLAGGAAPAVAAVAPKSAPVAPTPAPASPPSGALAGATVSGTVSLAPTLSSNVSPDDTVFVFARPVDGSRMPLAVVRGKVKDLPLAFTLDDSMAMTPTHRLSGQSEVIVGARVSRSGTVTPQPGDIEIVSAPVKVGMSGVSLVIDRKSP
jgi:cytochrome c-type biogenesis protein CcmH